jgi:AdoMet-dependent rRNA methyltransferase SPB1
MAGGSKKKMKAGKTRHDKWYYLAKEQGYRSRSAFKLVQLNKKYDFLRKAHSLLDLCAAPGGWMQVAARYMPVGSLIVGCDLLPIKPIPGCVGFQQDITSQECRARLMQETKGVPIDVVVHDGAPNVGGSTWAKDAYGQVELVLHSLKLATEFLRPGGTFVTKVFRSSDYNALLWVLKQFFANIDVTKPVASRNTSAEIYVYCADFLAPKKIDPRLLDPAFIFKQVDGEDGISTSRGNVLHGKKTSGKERHRTGYDISAADGLLYKQASVAKFVDSENPAEFLGSYNKLEFDDASKVYDQHADTSTEIRELCSDLLVLGRSDFKALLRWRVRMCKYRDELLGDDESDDEETKAAAAAAAAEAEARANDPEVQEQLLLHDLEELRAKTDTQKKALRRKRRERLRKELQRRALNANSIDIAEDALDDPSLFSLRATGNDDAQVLKQGEGKSDLPVIHRDDIPDSGMDSDEDRMSVSDNSIDNDDEDADRRRRMRQLEKEVDYAYQSYKKRKNIVSRQDKKKAKAVGLGSEADEDSMLEALAARIAPAADGDAEQADSESGSSDEDMDSDSDAGGIDYRNANAERRRANALSKQATSSLLTSLGVDDASAADRAQRWFSRDMFKDLTALPSDDKLVTSNKRKALRSPPTSSSEDDESDASPSDGEDPFAPFAMFESTTTTTQDNGKANTNGVVVFSDHSDDEFDADQIHRAAAAAASQNGSSKAFEEVSVEEYSDDSDARAEILALGTMMLRKDKRKALIDSGYNRYAFGGSDDLPDWFVEDEEQHYRATLPVTRDAVEAYKAELKAVNARPIKKIAEAKGRAKIRAVRRWEKLKKEAQNIAGSDQMTPSQKLQQIQKLYGRVKKKKERRPLVVAKKDGGRLQIDARKDARGPIKLVDRRMKSDMRGMRATARRAKKVTKSRNKSKASKRRKR